MVGLEVQSGKIRTKTLVHTHVYMCDSYYVHIASLNVHMRLLTCCASAAVGVTSLEVYGRTENNYDLKSHQ